MPKQRPWSDSQLVDAVRTSTSYAGVRQRLGVGPSGGNHYTIKARIAALGLKTSHFVATQPTEERLRAAVAASTKLVGVVERLDLTPDNATLQRVARWIRTRGLDTAHFTHAHGERSRRRRWTDDQLRVAVATSTSVAAVARALGLVPAGGNYASIHAGIGELSLDVSHFTGKGWNVGLTFRPRQEVPLTEVLVPDRWTSSHRLKLRLFRAGLKKAACEACGWAARAADGRIPLELDHINGNRNDNRIENLRILCPNCHSLQPTHRGLNQRHRRP